MHSLRDIPLHLSVYVEQSVCTESLTQRRCVSAERGLSVKFEVCRGGDTLWQIPARRRCHVEVEGVWRALNATHIGRCKTTEVWGLFTSINGRRLLPVARMCGSTEKVVAIEWSASTGRNVKTPQLFTHDSEVFPASDWPTRPTKNYRTAIVIRTSSSRMIKCDVFNFAPVRQTVFVSVFADLPAKVAFFGLKSLLSQFNFSHRASKGFFGLKVDSVRRDNLLGSTVT